MKLTDDIKEYLASQKEVTPDKTKIKVGKVQPSPISDYEELQDAWADFKGHSKGLVKILKWIFIGGLIVMNLISWSVYSSWNEFMGSPEYKQYLYRTGNEKRLN